MANEFKPSAEARKMKREQNSCHEENVTVLLNRRTEAQIVIEQVNADLTHVGYNWPQAAPQEKRLTEYEWRELIHANGRAVVNREYFDGQESKIEDLQKQVELQMAKVARLQKQLKKKPAKKPTGKADRHQNSLKK